MRRGNGTSLLVRVVESCGIRPTRGLILLPPAISRLLRSLFPSGRRDTTDFQDSKFSGVLHDPVPCDCKLWLCNDSLVHRVVLCLYVYSKRPDTVSITSRKGAGPFECRHRRGPGNCYPARSGFGTKYVVRSVWSVHVVSACRPVHHQDNRDRFSGSHSLRRNHGCLVIARFCTESSRRPAEGGRESIGGLPGLYHRQRDANIDAFA